MLEQWQMECLTTRSACNSTEFDRLITDQAKDGWFLHSWNVVFQGDRFLYVALFYPRTVKQDVDGIL